MYGSASQHVVVALVAVARAAEEVAVVAAEAVEVAAVAASGALMPGSDPGRPVAAAASVAAAEEVWAAHQTSPAK